jgi:TPR repeat protein
MRDPICAKSAYSFAQQGLEDKFLVGFLLVIGVTLLGCAKQPPEKPAEADATERASMVEVEREPVGSESQQGQRISTAFANFEAGIAAYEANNLPLAYQQFRAAAEQGHADSQFNLGLMYEQGIGVAKDERQAVVWYGKSAEQGNSAAQFNLGVLYENGRGTKVDFAQANDWYRKASLQGDALAIGNLGMLYVRGDGVPENKVAGVALLLMSATADPSPENNARRNVSATRGLTAEMIVEAQSLAAEFTSAENLLIPLDQYLQKTQTK